MDVTALALLLAKTLQPDTRAAAEAELDLASKVSGFAPATLQVVMAESVEQAVRQSAIIYLKNLIGSAWTPKEIDSTTPAEPNFTLNEQDKALIRENLVDATVRAPEVVRTQLCVCVSMIIKQDFPQSWPQVVDKIRLYMQTPEPARVSGALSCLYQLVKAFEYKKKEDRGPLNEAMVILLPIAYEIVIQSMPDRSQDATSIRKTILKIFYALTQHVLQTELLNQEFFTKWMEVVCHLVEAEVPAEAMNPELDEEDRKQLIWWKEKKWSLHIMTRIFERYGSPGNVTAEYKEFSEWYLKTFTQGMLNSVLKILDAYRRQVYVAPRVLQQSLNFVNTGVSHSLTWKLIKDHIMEIVKDILFPIMSYSESDAELWENDPYEYVRVKFDIFEDFVSPVTAAQTLLHSVCKKRKGVLPKTMTMLMAIVQDGNTTPSQKDGALHMIGTIADILLKKKNYKDQLEQFLMSIAFPEFNSPHGHLRARACWMLHYFADVKFKNQNVLGEAFRLTIDSLLKPNEDVPVKVEAAIALQMLLSSQEEIAKKYVEPRIREVTLELLNIIRQTENDDLTSVMQKIVCSYTDQLVPVAVDMCKHLVETFAQILESAEDGDDKAITAMGVLNTLETILTVMEDREDVHAQLEPIVLQAVHHIFTNNIMELYEEALTLSCDLTLSKISPDMWAMLKVIYNVFEADGLDYFTDMMPVLHNYVTVDTATFLSNPDNVTAIFLMCKKMLLEADPGEDPQCHAAKLIEVIILQCKFQGHNIGELIPSFVEVAFLRLSREIKTSELRTMCLQVAIAAMYYDSNLFFHTLQNATVPGIQGPLIKHFINQWINDTDCFLGLHDRKICALGLCQLMTMPELPGIEEFRDKIMPSLIQLFDGLKHAYEAQHEDDSDEDSDSDEDDDDDDGELEVLDSDEDEIDEDSSVYLESLQEKVNKSLNGSGIKVTATIADGDDEDDDDDDDDDDDGDYEETSLESYTTPLDEEDAPVDEYKVFKMVLQSLQDQNPNWYNQLMSPLSKDDLKSIQEVFKLCDQREAARESKNIEKQGGYQFQQQSVPGQFSFASSDQNFAFGN